MKSLIKNPQGGFISTILLIVVLLLLMKYFHVTFPDIWNWLKIAFSDLF